MEKINKEIKDKINKAKEKPKPPKKAKSIKQQMKEGTYKPSDAVQNAMNQGMPINANMAKFIDKIEDREAQLRPIRALSRGLEDLDKVKDEDVDRVVNEINRLIDLFASQPINRLNKSSVEKGVRNSKSDLEMHLRNRSYRKPKVEALIKDLKAENPFKVKNKKQREQVADNILGDESVENAIRQLKYLEERAPNQWKEQRKEAISSIREYLGNASYKYYYDKELLNGTKRETFEKIEKLIEEKIKLLPPDKGEEPIKSRRFF
jgi:hypothetical protein